VVTLFLGSPSRHHDRGRLSAAQTLIILCLGFCHLPRHGLRVLFGKVLYLISGGKVNP